MSLIPGQDPQTIVREILYEHYKGKIKQKLKAVLGKKDSNKTKSKK